MNKSLKGKMILSYLVVALITVLVVVAVIWMTSGRSLMNLVLQQQTAQLKETIQTYYASHDSLDGFFNFYLQTERMRPIPDQPESTDLPPAIRDIRGVIGLVDLDHRALIPSPEFRVGQRVPDSFLQHAIAVEVDGSTVAWIIPDTKLEFKLSAEEQGFLQRSTLAVVMAALIGVAAAVVMGVGLAGGLVKPINSLTRAAQALANGKLNQKVPVTTRDELGLLTETFNQMSADLLQADQERKRMTADITHDLSTPLQIISGYMEMLEEKKARLSNQQVEVIKTEIDHLRRLVSDLTTLSQAEGKGLDIQFQKIKPATLMKAIYKTYLPIAQKQGVHFVLNSPDSVAPIRVDEGRMLRVLNNLMENALRHTPPGGTISLHAKSHEEKVQLSVSDDGMGIKKVDLPYIFDRFYRADKARGTAGGKMGLGLAICKALVVAQHGSISAFSAGSGKGSTFTIMFTPDN